MQKSFSDKFLTALSIAYITIPIAIFFFGWLNYYSSIPAFCVLIYFSLKMYQELSDGTINLFHENKKFWLIATAALLLWVLMSGIGSFMYQSPDFAVRNPIYRDLCDYQWPVIYDLSQQSDFVKISTGSETVSFAYYLTYWLPPAFISKIFSLNELGRNVILYFYTVLGIFLALYNLCRYFKRTSYVILLALIFFSGMDIIGYLLNYACLAFSNGSGVIGFIHSIFPEIIWRPLENYAGGQYSSITTQLFWVFNQAVPVWLIVILLLQVKSNKNSLALSSLTFAYSSWAVFGMIPLALWSAFKIHKKFFSAFTFQNIALPLIMLIIYGTFYTSGNSVQGKSFYITIKNTSELTAYLIFIFLEFGIYMLIMGKTAAKYDFYYIVLCELLLFRIYTFDVNLIMRGTIPAIFILMTIVVKFLFEKENRLKRRKIILIVTFVVGSCTVMTEMNRNILGTAMYVLKKYDLLPASIAQRAKEKPDTYSLNQEHIYSLGKMRTKNRPEIELLRDQFFVYDYKNSVFFKYFAK